MQKSFMYKIKFTNVRNSNSQKDTFIYYISAKGNIAPDAFAKLLNQGIADGGIFVESWRTLIRTPSTKGKKA